jgi:hypothetical protein
MKIDENSYKLDNDNYFQVFYPKSKIILASSYNSGMKHFIGWTKRFNGNNKKTAHFTIATDGTIYKHFDENYRSNFMGNLILDEESVIIIIENYGWLINDYDNDRYIMDRIYIIRTADVLLFTEYCNSKGYLHKESQTYSSTTPFIENGIELDEHDSKVVITLKKGEYSPYPYMDTMKFYSPETGVISNRYIRATNGCIELTDTDGGPNEDEDYCPVCSNSSEVDCPECNGRSEIRCTACNGSGGDVDEPCSLCHGGGVVRCDICDGDGQVGCPECS